MRHLVVIVAVICAVIDNAWAQNRGSVRYAPPEDYEGDITRAPRLTPTRGAAVRRQRPTKAPEPTAVDDDLKPYQPPESPTRTTARRVPQRANPPQAVPHLSPNLPVEDGPSGYTAPVEDSQAPSTGQEGRTQGKRRRRPKKRRRPQSAASKVDEDSNKQTINEEHKTSITELLHDDKKRSERFQNNPTSRNSQSTYNLDPNNQPEKASWDRNPPSEQHSSAGGSPYYRPQTATNRLPIADSENPQGYAESSPGIPENDTPAPYVPKVRETSVTNDASYVPVLSPNRVSSEEVSRLLPENYHSNYNAPLRGHSNASPHPEVIRDRGAKPVRNIIPQPDEPAVPVRSHSEVRLPEDEKPILSPEYAAPGYDSAEDLSAPNSKAPGEIEESPRPSNRLPNPPENNYNFGSPQYSSSIRETQRSGGEVPVRNPRPNPSGNDYNSASSEYLGNIRGTQRNIGRRQEVEESPVRNQRPNPPENNYNFGSPQYSGSIRETQRNSEETPVRNPRPNPAENHYNSASPDYLGNIRGTQRNTGSRQEEEESSVRSPRPSYTTLRRDTGTKPQEYDNDAEVDRRQISQYRPPLQRTGSRYKPDDSEGPIRSRTQEQSPSTSAPRSRGTMRYHSPEYENTQDRGRSSTRTRSDTSSDSQTPRNSENTRSGGSVENVPRTSSRGQTENNEEISRESPSVGYVPHEEYIRSQQRSPSHSPRNRQRPTTVIEESDPEDHAPVRNTLRSRPQFEVREAEPTDSYEESVEDPNVYNPDYQRQTSSRGRTRYTASPQAQELPSTEYQPPPTRQQHRQQFQYESSQNPRARHQPQHEEPQNPRSRHQPQYEAPQNPRTDSRQNPSSRPQGRSRHQNSEPSPPPRRSSSGSNFACPDAFGFFADPIQCDKYYECRNGTAEMHLCNDGLAFNEISAPNFLRCDSIRDVDCKSRPELQEPQPTKNCPRKYGLFPHETDCTKFWNCVDGSATEVQCPPGLTYSDERATCDWADLVESSCTTEDLLGFTCPEPTAHDLMDGVYTRYRHPDNCQLHYTCIKGADGLRRPRMLSCTDGLVFDPATAACRRPEEVPGCEDFYGVRTPAPKRKPSRQPEPEPEEIEEPTPRPRRRGSSRRTRN